MLYAKKNLIESLQKGIETVAEVEKTSVVNPALEAEIDILEAEVTVAYNSYKEKRDALNLKTEERRNCKAKLIEVKKEFSEFIASVTVEDLQKDNLLWDIVKAFQITPDLTSKTPLAVLSKMAGITCLTNGNGHAGNGNGNGKK